LLQVGFLFLAFVIPRFTIESVQQSSSNRLLGVGAHVHNTYYAGSSVILSSAIKQQETPDYEHIKDFSLKLSDKSKVYPDNELCHFYTQAAYWLADEQKKPILALDFFRLALEQNNEYEIALKGAVIILQNQNSISESLPLVQMLLKIQPNIKEYHQMLLNCYVALQMQKELQIAVNNYLKLFPEDREMIRSKLGI
jgi:tetratricopeptide (TPR) repeat protein